MTKKTKHYDVLLVGAGLFNAVLSYRLTTIGRKVLVIDRRNHIGGNCYSENRDGIEVHKYGAHIFHTSDMRVVDFALKFDTFNGNGRPFINSPVAVAGDGQVYNMPFNMNTFARIFGVSTPDEARRAIRGDIATVNLPKHPANLEDKAISMVGPLIYELLVKGYTEKQWGRPCSELPPDIITLLPLRFTYDNNYFDDWFQGVPDHGYAEWIRRMFSGAEIRLGIDYHEDHDKWNSMVDVVYYSGSIDEYFDYVFGPLEYRSLRFVEKTYRTDNRQGNAVVNYTSSDRKYTRSIEHRFFMPACTSNKTIVSYEYPAAWKPGTEPYYPINSHDNMFLYERYKILLGGCGTRVIPVGRLGMYAYMDMDDTILAALNMPLWL